MAKIGKPRLAKKNQKARPRPNEVASGRRSGRKPTIKEPVLKAVSAAPTPSVDKKSDPATPSTVSEKKVSQKLIETIEKRKKAAGKSGMLFSRPPGRRGRRPKGMAEYTPEHQEEDTYAVESDHTSLEYDTGISVKPARDDGAFNLDRFEDYDEELNFDW